VVGRRDDRLQQLAAGIHGVNSKTTPLLESVHEFAGDEGISVVVDTVGSIASVTELLPQFAHAAHLVSAGFYGNNGLIDIQPLRDKEITLYAPSGWNKQRMDETLEGIRDGWLNTRSLITHHFPVDRAADAWHLINTTAEPFLGVVLEWQ